MDESKKTQSKGNSRDEKKKKIHFIKLYFSNQQNLKLLNYELVCLKCMSETNEENRKKKENV